MGDAYKQPAPLPVRRLIAAQVATILSYLDPEKYATLQEWRKRPFHLRAVARVLCAFVGMPTEGAYSKDERCVSFLSVPHHLYSRSLGAVLRVAPRDQQSWRWVVSFLCGWEGPMAMGR